MTTLHAFPQSARLSPQPLIPSPSIEKMRSAKVDMAPPRSISPTKSSVMKHLSNSTSVPSLRQVAVQQQQQISSQTLPNQKLKGMAGARQRAKDVWQRRKGSGSDLETTMSTVLELDGVDSRELPRWELKKKLIKLATVPNRPLATARQDTASGWRRHAFGSAMISSITPPPRMEELSILSPMETKNGRTSPNATNCQQANSTQDLPPAVPPKTPTGQNNKDISFFFERSPSIMDRSPVCEPVRAQTPQQPARPESPTLREELDAFRSYRTVSPIVSRPIPIRPGRPASPPKDNVQVFRKPLLVDTTRPRPSSPVKKETRSVTPLSDKRFEEPRKCPERPTPQTRPRAESVPLEASRLHKERRDKKEKEKKEQRPQLQLNTKTTQQSPVQPQKPLQPAPIEPLRPTPRTPEKPNLHKRQKSSTSDLWALPSGVRPVHAHGRYKAGEIQSLQHDARKQAQKYEVLRAVDVEQLSKVGPSHIILCFLTNSNLGTHSTRRPLPISSQPLQERTVGAKDTPYPHSRLPPLPTQLLSRHTS